ncbi:MAG: membrane dipeptidase [Planctomycetota bacterium]
MPIFDAHLDLAYLVEKGRDMHADPDHCRGTLLPASVTLPSLIEGGVTHCLATVFTEGTEDAVSVEGPFMYQAGDADAAHAAGMRQLMLYESWHRAGAIGFFGDDPSTDGAAPPISVGILIENADPVRTVEELDDWVHRGVVAVGLSWATQGRYAAGNGVDPDLGKGLTDEGREMVRALGDRGVVLDLSHLSQRATGETLELATGPLVATHSNCRALFVPDGEPGKLNKRTQRHISDETIVEIGRRGGVVGLNLLSDFLEDGLRRGDRAGFEHCVRHVEHVCGVMGHRNGVGLGTDMDGGFGADRLPAGIDRPADLIKLCEALSARGWSDDEVGGFAYGNWARVFGLDD